MDTKDIILLTHLAKFDKPITISIDNAPHEIKVNFQFQGLDRARYPGSIYVRLFELSKFNLVKSSYANMWEITEPKNSFYFFANNR